MSTDNEKDKITTLDYAIGLVDTKGNSYDDWKTRSLGLQLTLLGLAETQAKRVSMLSESVVNLEEKVFSEQSLNDQSPQQLLNLYKMSTESLQRSVEYVKMALAGTDWNKLEADLVTIQTRQQTRSVDGKVDQDSAKIAEEIINRLNQLKNKSLQEAIEDTGEEVKQIPEDTNKVEGEKNE